MTNPCPICESTLRNLVPNPGQDRTAYECPLCGKFSLTESLVEDLPSTIGRNEDSRTKLSHNVRLMQQTASDILLNTTTAREVLSKPLPDPKEQADIFIRWIAQENENPGVKITIAPSVHRTILGAKTDEGFYFVIDHLIEEGLLIGERLGASQLPGAFSVALSFEGWEYRESLLLGRTSYRKAFMAMKFNDVTLEDMLENIFKPACLRAGFELIKLDDVPIAGLIDDRLRVEIQSSDFIIADLTHDNLGAYWEAGYAEGLGKPVIYTCEKEKFESDPPHFDTNHHLTVPWSVDNPEVTGDKITAIIRATLPVLADQ